MGSSRTLTTVGFAVRIASVLIIFVFSLIGLVGVLAFLFFVSDFPGDDSLSEIIRGIIFSAVIFLGPVLLGVYLIGKYLLALFGRFRAFRRQEESWEEIKTKSMHLVGGLGLVMFSLTILAIAIPSTLRATIPSNESSAIGALRTVASAQSSFQEDVEVDVDGDGTGEFGSLAALANTDPPFIDEMLGSGQKSGYYFKVIVSNRADEAEVQWWATACPVEYEKTGVRTFYVDESGAIVGSDIGGRPVESREEGQALPPIGG